jgi:hypothetical protein
MKETEKISGVTFVPDLKSRQIKLGVEAQKKHEQMLALIERTKKKQAEAALADV